MVEQISPDKVERGARDAKKTILDLSSEYDHNKQFEMADFLRLVYKGLNEGARFSLNQKDLVLQAFEDEAYILALTPGRRVEKAMSTAAFINTCH